MRRRNKFSLSHFKLLTGKMGYLYPVACVETLPGDTFQMATSVFLRFSPMVAPVMTPVVVKVHHYFVPTRLLWDDFEDFITGGPDGMSVPTPPNFNLANTSITPVLNCLGIPKLSSNSPNLICSALPMRAYNLIYNEYYRDQNLEDPIAFNTDGGRVYSDNTPIDIRRSAWDKDYFTTATPWEQKGAAVNVPVNGTPAGSIAITGAPAFSGGASDFTDFTGISGSGNVITVAGKHAVGDSFSNYSTNITASAGTLAASFTGDASLGQINLNQFREAMALQRFEEHRALYGSRYVEYLRYLGVKASDGRLQRPEYLGGGRSVIQFSEVLQTAQDGDTPVGTMRGHGIGAMRTNRFRRFFEEHGYVITLLSIRPKSIYTQGLPRMFSRTIKTDYWQKELEHVGQQEVYVKELYNNGLTMEERDSVFGYSDRYNEYRSHPSTVCGEFLNTLDYWHLGRVFYAKPVLNSDFVNSLPSDRIFADRTGNDTIYMMVNNSIQARRLVSKRGNPI